MEESEVMLSCRWATKDHCWDTELNRPVVEYQNVGKTMDLSGQKSQKMPPSAVPSWLGVGMPRWKWDPPWSFQIQPNWPSADRGWDKAILLPPYKFLTRIKMFSASEFWGAVWASHSERDFKLL